MLSRLTKVALSIDTENRNLIDSDLLEANERYHPSPGSDADQASQWSYKEALVALKSARAITLKEEELTERATTHTYSQYSNTLSGNQRFGGQNITRISYTNPDNIRTFEFYELIGNSIQNRLFDANNLINDNKDWIVEADTIENASSPVDSTRDKCKRDITFFLEAIAFNLSNGGNSRIYDYALISRDALEEQANKTSESRTLSDLIDIYKTVINGDGTFTDTVRSRLEAVINGSADVNNDGTTLLQETGITVASDNCIDVVSSVHTFLDLLLYLIEEGAAAPVQRTNPYSNSQIGNGRLNDAAKLIDDPIIREWLKNPPSISDTNKFDPNRCPRDIGYFLDAISYQLIRGGNSLIHDNAVTSRNSLLDQASDASESRSYDELIYDYFSAINGRAGTVGLRDRLQQVVQGTAIIDGTPLNISDFDITPASDQCSDVTSAINTYLDIILKILKEGGSAVKKTPILGEPFPVPDNRENQDSAYKRSPYSFNGTQIAKCLRDVKYYIRYISYGLVANDFGVIDDLFLNGLVEVNRAFGLDSNWYRTSLEWIKQDLTENPEYYFGSNSESYSMPSNITVSFTITTQDQKDKTIEFIDYVISRI